MVQGSRKVFQFWFWTNPFWCEPIFPPLPPLVEELNKMLLKVCHLGCLIFSDTPIKTLVSKNHDLSRLSKISKIKSKLVFLEKLPEKHIFVFFINLILSLISYLECQKKTLHDIHLANFWFTLRGGNYKFAPWTIGPK